MSDKTKRSIICDSCDAELIVDSSYPAKYSLELKSIITGINTTGMMYANIVTPPLNSSLHFCDLDCLTNWVNNND